MILRIKRVNYLFYYGFSSHQYVVNIIALEMSFISFYLGKLISFYYMEIFPLLTVSTQVRLNKYSCIFEVMFKEKHSRFDKKFGG